jgi:hypothetical protein
LRQGGPGQKGRDDEQGGEAHETIPWRVRERCRCGTDGAADNWRRRIRTGTVASRSGCRRHRWPYGSSSPPSARNFSNQWMS